MRTTPKPPRKEKMVPFPARLDRRATLALHTLEGIPDEFLRAVARHAPGERVRVLAETGVVRYAPSEGAPLFLAGGTRRGSSSDRHDRALPVDRAKVRLALILDRLAKAKDLGETQCPLEPADAEALYGLAWSAFEDMGA